LAQDAPRPRPFVRYWLPVLAYVGLIFTLSAQPGLQPPFHFQYADKVAHISEYGVLGFLLARALRTVPRFRSLLLACGFAVAIGAGIGSADELFQSTVPGRDSSVYDLIADTIGLTLAQLAYLWVERP
jgi:VanZ family protein